MKNNCGFNAEKFTKLFNMRNVLRTYDVFAEEQDPDGSTNPVPDSSQTAPVNFEQLIAKAREEEKNKLYPTIDKLKNENSTYVQTHNEDLIAIATRDKEIERLNNEIKTLQSQIDGKESEALKTLKKELKAAQDEVQTLKDSAPNVEELRENIRAEIKSEYDLKFYREKKIQEAIKILSSPQWISIDDDLPYKHENLLVGNETVLVVVADIFGNVDTDFMTYTNGAWGWWSNSNAVYWLPLPEFTND